MGKEKRLNMQIKEKLVLRLKELSVTMTKANRNNKMITMQSLADKAIEDLLQKNNK